MNTDREFAENSAKSIDWSRNIEMMTATCYYCNAVFTSATKTIRSASSFVMVSKRPCRACGSHVLRRATSDWGREEIRPDQITSIKQEEKGLESATPYLAAEKEFKGELT